MPLTTYAISQVSSPTFAGNQNGVAFITSRKQFAFAVGSNLIWVDINGTIQGSALAVGIGTITSVFYASAIDRVIAFSGSNIASINPSSLAITTNNPGSTALTFGDYSATSNIVLGAAGAFADPRFFDCSTLTSPGISAGRSEGIAWASSTNEFFICRGGTNNIAVVNAATRSAVTSINNTYEPKGCVYCGPTLNTIYVGAGGTQAGRFYNASTRSFLSNLAGSASFATASQAYDETTGLLISINGTSGNENTIINPAEYRVISTFTTAAASQSRAAAGLGVFMVAHNLTTARHFRASYSFASGRIEEDLFTFNFSTSTITVLRSEPFFSFCTALDAFPYQGLSVLFETVSATDANVNANMILTGTADIPADGTLTFVGSRTLTLGTKSSYTLRASIPAAGIVEVRNDVSLLGFTFASGATINKASGVGGTITVTLTSTTGITAGTGVVLTSPQSPVTVTAVDTSQNPIAGAAVYLETSPGAVVILNGETDSSGEITTDYSGSTPQAVVGWVRSGSGPIAYIDFPLGGNITSSGYNQTAILQEEQ